MTKNWLHPMFFKAVAMTLTVMLPSIADHFQVTPQSTRLQEIRRSNSWNLS